MRRAAILLALVSLSGTALADPVVENQRLRVRLDPGEGTVHGLSEMRVVPEAGGVLSLELASGLRVTSVLRDGAPVEPVVDSDLGNGITVWRFPVLHDAEAPEEARALLSVSWSGGLTVPRGSRFGADGIDLGRASRWFPHPGQPFTWQAELDVPAGLRCVLRGRLVRRAEKGERATETWGADVATDGLPLAAGPWTSLTRDGVTVWGAEPDAGLLDAAVQAYREIVARLGACPAPGFSVLPESALTASTAPGFASTLWGDLGLQATRCWWGYAVLDGPGRGHWADALATHTSAQLRGEAASAIARRTILERLQGDTAASSPGRRVLAFHALRRTIGDDAFRTALRSVLRERAGQVTTWPDWTDAFRAASGRDVADLVRQWTQRPGAPLLVLDDVRLATSNGRVRVSGTIRQTLPEGEAPWRQTVPVRIETLDGGHDVEVEVAGADTAFQWMAHALPLRLALDPANDVARRLRRSTGAERVPEQVELLPRIGNELDGHRITKLRSKLADAPDVRWALHAAVDDIGIAGLDSRVRDVDVEVRDRDGNAVVTVAGDPVAGCHALTCSPETADEGVELLGIADDPAGTMEGRALTVDVPRSTDDLAAFARGFAGIARGAGARALILRVAPEDMKRHAATWTTPSDGPGDAHTRVLRARAAQLGVGEELVLPTVVVPAGFAPDGELRVRVAWETRSTRVGWGHVTIAAPNGRPGPVLLLTRVGPESARAATVVTHAAQLFAPHAALLGRDVVVGLLPDDDGVDAALSALLHALPDPPAITVWIGSLPAGLRLEGDAQESRVAAFESAVATCFGFGDQRSAARLALTSGAVPGPVIEARLSSLTRGPKEPWPDERLARGLALAAIALSVAP